MLAVEKLLGITAPERGAVDPHDVLRDHAHAEPSAERDVVRAWMWVRSRRRCGAIEEREKLMEFYEAASGARMHANYFRPGGVNPRFACRA